VSTRDDSEPRRQVFYIGPEADRGGVRVGVGQYWPEHELGPLKTWNADTQGSITLELVADLAQSRAIVADVRGGNPNVLYEIGLAHAFDTPVIPLKAKDDKSLPFDICDQSAIEVKDGTDDDRFHYVIDKLRERLSSLERSPSRTIVTMYWDQLAREQGPDEARTENRLPVNGWEYLARGNGLARLTRDNARGGLFVFHLAYGLGEIVEHGPGGHGAYEVSVVFSDRPRSLVLPDERAFLAEPQ
jgi:hypothetical protein